MISGVEKAIMEMTERIGNLIAFKDDITQMLLGGNFDAGEKKYLKTLVYEADEKLRRYKVSLMQLESIPLEMY